MLVNAAFDELRVAITDGPRLIDLDIEVPGQVQTKSNIYKGVISSIEPSLAAVFVNYGRERHGFLPIKDVSSEYFLSKDEQALETKDLKKLLKIGQEVVVQIVKEERGTKGAALTTFISVAGSFLVLMPNNPKAGGVSRRIEGDMRDQLSGILSELNVPEGMGLIIRTAGVTKSKDELAWDLKVLLHYWEAIKQAAIARRGPYLIHQESDVIIRAVRDNLRQDISEIVIDEPRAFERVYHYISQVRPDFVPRLKLYNDVVPLSSRFQVEQQIESAYQREVHLPSGGSLVIDPTEALVAIDINSARATRGSNIEETALNTNLEAAEEIARQLRIRDIGGLIVIDFIDMTPVRNQCEVENCLREALRNDRARIQIGNISQFGLLEMSRQRLRSALTKSSQMSCPRCNGQGAIRNVESQTLSIIHLIQEQAAKEKNIHFCIQLPINVATYLINEKRDVLKQIEEHCKVKITVIPNEHLQSPHYHLQQVKCDLENMPQDQMTPSYRLVKVVKTEPALNKQNIQPSVVQPVIEQFLTSVEVPVDPSKSLGGGLIKRLWTKMFGVEESKPNTISSISATEEKRKHAQEKQQRFRRTTSRRPPRASMLEKEAEHGRKTDVKVSKISARRSARGGFGGYRRRYVSPLGDRDISKGKSSQVSNISQRTAGTGTTTRKLSETPVSTDDIDIVLKKEERSITYPRRTSEEIPNKTEASAKKIREVSGKKV